jgi:hypothetical protein
MSHRGRGRQEELNVVGMIYLMVGEIGRKHGNLGE